MGKPAAAAKADPIDLESLCREYARIEHDNEPVLKRRSEISALIRQRVTATGEKYRLVVLGCGTVSVSPGHPERVTGQEPRVGVEAYLALPKSRRDKLAEQGIVKMEPVVKDAYAGQVRFTAF